MGLILLNTFRANFDELFKMEAGRREEIKTSRYVECKLKGEARELRGK